MTSNSKKCIVFFLVLFIGINVNAQRKKRHADTATKEWKYDIECMGTGKKGVKLIKVWSYSKRKKFAISQAMKNAVHGILFKGFAGKGRGCTELKPLINREMSKEEYNQFFKDFFGDGKYGGEYTKYVTESNDGNIGAGDRVRVGKNLKIGVIVSVMTDLLRKRLEEEGIIKGLSSGF
jgi:hypothetical protein